MEPMEDALQGWVEFSGDRSVRFKNGDTLLQLAQRADISLLHVCGGRGRCTTCRVQVISGELSAPSSWERRISRKAGLPADVRLACQARPVSPNVVVHRIMRDESDVATYLEAGPDARSGEAERVLMFLDIQNFTPFMQNNPPFDVVHVLRRLFRLFRQAIEQFGGQIIETAGDGLYAVFGGTTNKEAACRDAFHCSRTILSGLEELNVAYLQPHFQVHLRTGIGLHAGNVILGNIGLDNQPHPLVMGLPVNIAARIQSATRACNNDLLVSEEVGRHLPENERGNVSLQLQLKGLSDPVTVFACGRPFD